MTPTSSKAIRGVYSPGFDSALAKCFEMLLNLPPTDTSASICLFIYLLIYFFHECLFLNVIADEAKNKGKKIQ